MPEPLSMLTGMIIRAAVRLHQEFGPGLVESFYELALCRELELDGLSVRRHVPIDSEYRGHRFVHAFRIDLLAEGSVVIEVKAFDSNAPRQRRQLLTYLRLSIRPVGLILNFGEATLAKGIARVVNGHFSGQAQ